MSSSCQDLLGKTYANELFHVNAMTNQNIMASFEKFIMDVVEDQEKNGRNEDYLDEMWDESIKLGGRRSSRQGYAKSPLIRSPSSAKRKQEAGSGTMTKEKD